MIRASLCVTAVVLALAAGAASARKVETGIPAQMQKLFDCRALKDGAQRLACFDRETAAVDQAVGRKDIVLIDRDRARAAKRSLFGFSVPSFGGLLGNDAEVSQIESTITRASQNGEGGMVVALADGSVWSQTDDSVLALAPRAGEKVIVKRGALGSFFVKVGSQPGFKAKRIG